MNELTIIFVGLITFIGIGDKGRDVAVLDISHGTEVHGHYVQEHDALLIVAPGDVIDHENWDPRDSEKGLLFALDGYTLSFDGIQEAQPFSVDSSYECFIPQLSVECPGFGKIRPMSQIAALSAATFEMKHGRLSACRPNSILPAVSMWNVQTTGNQVTIHARKGSERRSVTIKSNARIRVENEPAAEEAVGNHFIAYYALSASSTCCTNIPFQRKPAGRCPEGKSCGDMTILTTAACSNSNYP
jgi:hypothetical protein